MTKYIVDAYSHLLEKMYHEETALHASVRYGALDAAVVLLDAAVDINAKGKDGYTPLHLSAQHGSLEIMNMLLDRGADIMAKTDTANTPLEIAALNNQHSCVKDILIRLVKNIFNGNTYRNAL